MKLREVRAVAGKELRETLRDRRTIAVMVLFPHRRRQGPQARRRDG